jgi:hypothetical protein
MISCNRESDKKGIKSGVAYLRGKVACHEVCRVGEDWNTGNGPPC